MKKRGFTLIELLGVVIILGVLALILFPILINQIRKTKEGISDTTKALIIDSAKDYYEDNINNYDKIEGMTYCIDISTLTENNYLNKKLKDENLNDIDDSKKVKLIYHNNKINYDITNTCNNNSLSRNNIEVPIVTEDRGLYKSATDIDRFIYRGRDPINNWIELNEGTEETPDYVKYRIISFENDGTIKVIRNESIGQYAWDEAGSRLSDGTNNTYCTSSDGCNVWGNGTNTLFNGVSLSDNFHYSYYNNNTTITLTNGESGKVEDESTLNSYLNGQTTSSWQPAVILDDYIFEHLFNVGGIHYIENYIGGDKGITKEKAEESLYTWNGKIGLMNITEYVEASLNPTCTSVYSNYYYNTNYYYDKNNDGEKEQTISSYDDWPCSNRNYNWMAKEITEWLLSPRPHNSYSVRTVSSSGHFGHYSARSSLDVRPTFYLKPDITLSGEGSETSPYRITN